MSTDSIGQTRDRSLTMFFVLAYAISWAVEIPLALRAKGLIDIPIPFAMHYLAGYGPMLAAVVVTSITDGKRGLANLFRRMLKWRLRPVWWLVATSPLVLYMIVAIVQLLIQGQWPPFSALGQVDYLPNLGFGALLLWFLTFGLGEETGWRGFALPRLQERRTALTATIILWVFWTLWHLPMFFYLYDVTVIAGLLLGLLAGSITFTWLYNSTGGSILMTAMWHGAFNFVTGCIACKAGLVAAVLSTFVMIWALVVVLWFKPSTLSHACRQES